MLGFRNTCVETFEFFYKGVSQPASWNFIDLMNIKKFSSEELFSHR
jgi:hypothetical protein